MKLPDAIVNTLWLSLSLSTLGNALTVEPVFPKERFFTHSDGRNCTWMDQDPKWGYKCDSEPSFPGANWFDPSPMEKRDTGVAASNDTAFDGSQWVSLGIAGFAAAVGLITMGITAAQFDISKKFYFEKYEAIFNPEAAGGKYDNLCIKNYNHVYKFTGKNGGKHHLYGCLAKEATQQGFCHAGLKKSEEDLILRNVQNYIAKDKSKARIVCVQIHAAPVSKDGVEGPKDGIIIRGKYAITDKKENNLNACDFTCGDFHDVDKNN